MSACESIIPLTVSSISRTNRSQSADQALALFDHSMTSVRSNVARDQAHKAKQDDALAHSLTSIAEKLSQERPSGGRSGGQRGADMGMGMWGGPGMDMGMGMGSMGGARGMGAGNGFGSEDLAGLMDVDQEGYSGGPTRSKKKWVTVLMRAFRVHSIADDSIYPAEPSCRLLDEESVEGRSLQGSASANFPVPFGHICIIVTISTTHFDSSAFR